MSSVGAPPGGGARRAQRDESERGAVPCRDSCRGPDGKCSRVLARCDCGMCERGSAQGGLLGTHEYSRSATSGLVDANACCGPEAPWRGPGGLSAISGAIVVAAPQSARGDGAGSEPVIPRMCVLTVHTQSDAGDSPTEMSLPTRGGALYAAESEWEENRIPPRGPRVGGSRALRAVRARYPCQHTARDPRIVGRRTTVYLRGSFCAAGEGRTCPRTPRTAECPTFKLERETVWILRRYVGYVVNWVPDGSRGREMAVLTRDACRPWKRGGRGYRVADVRVLDNV